MERKTALDALGPDRTQAIAGVTDRLEALRPVVQRADTEEVWLHPLRGDAVAAWQRAGRIDAERWTYIKTPEGDVVALDRPSAAVQQDPDRLASAAVLYPELHMRLVAWWLVHAWRCLDLLDTAVTSLVGWRMYSASISARAVMEEAGCLCVEASKLEAAWSTLKSARRTSGQQPAAVHNALVPMLNHAGLGSRIKGSHSSLQATNVMTLVQKLGKMLGRDLQEMYDWLSDAAHPAYAGRMAYATPGFEHPTGAYTSRHFAPTPLSLIGSQGETMPLLGAVADHAADAVILCGTAALDLLDGALHLVDDFGLTTGAANLTSRNYWRNLEPVRGNRACTCGRGKWRDCGHFWGTTAPPLRRA